MPLYCEKLPAAPYTPVAAIRLTCDGECTYDDASRVCATHGCVIVYGRQYGCPECGEKLRKLREASVDTPQEKV